MKEIDEGEGKGDDEVIGGAAALPTLFPAKRSAFPTENKFRRHPIPAVERDSFPSGMWMVNGWRGEEWLLERRLTVGGGQWTLLGGVCIKTKLGEYKLEEIDEDGRVQPGPEHVETR